MKENKTKLFNGMCGILLFVLVFFLYQNVSTGSYLYRAEEAGQKHKVAVIAKSSVSAFWRSVHSGVNAASAAYNMDYIFEAPENEEDCELQNDMIRQAAEDGYEAIVVSAIDFEGNAEAITQAAKDGVEIVVIDSDVDSDEVVCRIGTDNYNAGSMAADAVFDCDEERIRVGIVNFDENSENGQEREQGFRDSVAADERVEIVDCINVVSTTEDAMEGTKQMLTEHPEINVIVTFNEWTSLGVGYTIKECNLGEDIYVVAFDSNVVSVGMLETGEVDALIVQNPYAMGYLGIEAAYNLVNGYALEAAEVDTSTTLVTKENMYDADIQKALFVFES